MNSQLLKYVGLRSPITFYRSEFPLVRSYKTVTTKIRHPENDHRKYRHIVLKNSLSALVIQDATIDKAAAALDVGVGSFSDPKNLSGLAHFCEHLLFMGSKKFPNINDYSAYLTQNGGYSNAYTGSQNTNYYFEINHQHLFGALERFAGFFTCPLFDSGATDKEINAIDSEHKKNLQNDIWRQYQLDKHLSNHSHPYHRFPTGSHTTLGTEPRNYGIDIRQELLKYYNKWYSANIMNFCIIGRENLDTLSEWTDSLFSPIGNKDVTIPTFKDPIWTASDTQKLVRIESVKNLQEMEVKFKVFDFEDESWESKPSYVLSHLFGHEGTGSLLASLKSQDLIHSISAGGERVSTNNSFFSINMDLTQKGMLHYDDIAVEIFEYIKMLKLKLPQKWLFDELQHISNNSFKFKQNSGSAATVSLFSKLMEKKFIPMENILSHSIFYKFDPDNLMKYLNTFTVENSRIILSSNKMRGLSEIEKWYGTKYDVVDYPDTLKKKLSNISLTHKLSLPIKNAFISDNFIVQKNKNSIQTIEPYLLKDNGLSKLWYKKDDTFWQPRGTIFVSIKLPHTHASLVNEMLTAIYTELVNDKLQDLRYSASCANLYVFFNKTNQGLEITVTGFSDKLLILLTRYIQGIKSFVPSEKSFAMFKRKMLQNLENKLYSTPFSQARRIYSSIINERSWTIKEQLDVLRDLNFKQLEAFVPTIFEELYFETLVFGNLSYVEALEVDSEVIKLAPNNIKNTQVKNDRLRSYIIPQGETFKYEEYLKDQDNVNNCLFYIMQFGIYSEHLAAVTGLLAQIMNEPCFNTLRTEEQLGYIVSSFSLSNHGTANLGIIVQSEFDTEYLQWRVENFLKQFAQYLREMPRDTFKEHRQAYCDSLLQKYKNMQEESSRISAAIYLGDYNFTHRQKKANYVSKLSKFDILYYLEQFAFDPVASRLIINLKSQKISKSGDVPTTPTYQDVLSQRKQFVINNIDQFKSHLCTAPARQPYKEWKVFSEATNLQEK